MSGKCPGILFWWLGGNPATARVSSFRINWWHYNTGTLLTWLLQCCCGDLFDWIYQYCLQYVGLCWTSPARVILCTVRHLTASIRVWNSWMLEFLVSLGLFFNLFFEAECFAVILIADGTHGCSQEFVLGARIHFVWSNGPENASSGR